MLRYLKNSIPLFLWIAYFIFYYSWKFNQFLSFINMKFFNSQIFDYIKVLFNNYWEVLMSYITWLIWFFTIFWLVWIINLLIEKKIKFYLSHNKYSIIVDFLIKFLTITKYLLAFYVFSFFAILPEFIQLIAGKVYSIIILVIILYFLTIVVNRFFEYELIEKSKLKIISKNLLPFVNKIVVVLIWFIWGITIMWNIWYNISAILTWAWIWGLAIAFAAQKSIWNIFWALIILLNQPFKIWDNIGVNWIIWDVKDIWLSYLTLIDKMWHQVMIPNEVIISNNVENFTVRQNRRTDFSIWIVYDTHLNNVEKWVSIIENILEKHRIEKTIWEYRVNFEQFWPFSLNINVTYFSLLNKSLNEYIKQKQQINIEIKKEFEKANINMAFPTQELIIKSEKLSNVLKKK